MYLVIHTLLYLFPIHCTVSIVSLTNVINLTVVREKWNTNINLMVKARVVTCEKYKWLQILGLLREWFSTLCARETTRVFVRSYDLRPFQCTQKCISVIGVN